MRTAFAITAALVGSAIAAPGLPARDVKYVEHVKVVTALDFVYVTEDPAAATPTPKPQPPAPQGPPPPGPPPPSPPHVAAAAGAKDTPPDVPAAPAYPPAPVKSNKPKPQPQPQPAPTPAPNNGYGTPPNAAPVPAPAPSPPTGGSSGGSGGSSGSSGKSGYMGVVDTWRAKLGMSDLTQDSKLEANAMDTVTAGNGQMVHKLNPGTYGQVLAPGGPNDFEHVFVGGWLCEKPNMSGLNDVCQSQSKGWTYGGQTGHADILTSKQYKKIGCALAAGIWGCDLA